MVSNRLFCALLFLVVAHQVNAQGVKQAQDPVTKAINRANAYLVSDKTELDLQSLFLYQYVQRKFELQPISDRNIGAEISSDHLFYPFLRMVKGASPEVDASIFDNAGSSIDRLTLQAMYCDRFPVHETFIDSIAVAADKGKYFLTHSLWALQLLEENECLKDSKRFKSISNKIAVAVAEMIQEAGFKDDVAIEGICFLYGMDRADLVKDDWVKIIANHQASDGGWFRTPKNNLTNTKTTVLALWCLLEFQSKGTAKEPWIVR